MCVRMHKRADIWDRLYWVDSVKESTKYSKSQTDCFKDSTNFWISYIPSYGHYQMAPEIMLQTLIKIKIKKGHFLRILISEALRMARVKQGCLTCHPHTYPQIPLLQCGQYSIPIPQRVGGWVGQGGWLHTKMVCISKDGHPSQYQPTDSVAAGIELITRLQVNSLNGQLVTTHYCVTSRTLWLVTSWRQLLCSRHGHMS